MDQRRRGAGEARLATFAAFRFKEVKPLERLRLLLGAPAGIGLNLEVGLRWTF